jgi:glycosyltransferase involved in cell wall biosynthesis
MKIGIFLPNATFDMPGTREVGGIETFSFTVGEEWQRLGHEVVLFGGAPKEGRSHRATTLKLELHPYWETKSIPDIGTRFQRLVQRLHFAYSIRRAWKEQRCDVVLLAKPFDWPVAWWWKKSRPDLKVIMGFHGTDFFAGDKLFFGAVDAAFAVSPRTADLAVARLHRRPTFIANPVDVATFHATAGTPPPNLAKPWRLVASGRLIGWKGFSDLLEAFARLRKEHRINAQLTLAGDGPERENLAAQIARLGLANHVTFPGRLDPAALAQVFRKGELGVVPSVGLDACPIGALEAVTTGLPLLVSDQVGLADFLTVHDLATYPAGNIDALTAALVQLHGRRGNRAWTDHAGRHARLREQFSAERVARRILDLAA